ncbi:hypothetical protein L484_026796 [Morus notabilis]|uniref:Uncharacterized protein n=1 Tax=Morus notabilis TaxID=981085 RepID=W9SDB1_9ROSA|nr:hypothetical protein L484_026796 [Morus notabilis]
MVNSFSTGSHGGDANLLLLRGHANFYDVNNGRDVFPSCEDLQQSVYLPLSDGCASANNGGYEQREVEGRKS